MEYEYVCPKCGKIEKFKRLETVQKKKIIMKYVDIVNLS